MPIRVVALDLEGTLIFTTYDPVPRPGLHEFLSFCCSEFPRVALFTAASRENAMEALQAGVDAGAIPPAFVDRLEFIEWEGEHKDLAFVPDCQPSEVVFVEDNADWIRPDQRDRWIAVPEFLGDEADDAVLVRARHAIQALQSQGDPEPQGGS